jgi:hypothetical protein
MGARTRLTRARRRIASERAAADRARLVGALERRLYRGRHRQTSRRDTDQADTRG